VELLYVRIEHSKKIRVGKMDTLRLLQYLAASCGVMGFIISPGLTVVYPWLREKFNKERRAKTDELLNKEMLDLGNPSTVADHLDELRTHFRFDWRPRVLRAKRRTKKLYKELANRNSKGK